MWRDVDDEMLADLCCSLPDELLLRSWHETLMTSILDRGEAIGVSWKGGV